MTRFRLYLETTIMSEEMEKLQREIDPLTEEEINEVIEVIKEQPTQQGPQNIISSLKKKAKSVGQYIRSNRAKMQNPRNRAEGVTDKIIKNAGYMKNPLQYVNSVITLLNNKKNTLVKTAPQVNQPPQPQEQPPLK
jgi:molecular chaperone GrpE (heat shock protein)